MKKDKSELKSPLAAKSSIKLAAADKTRQDSLFSRNIIAALDIGTSKVCCFIAEIKSHGTIEVIGIGHQASKGVKAGAIIDLKAAETAVAHAVEAAELMAKDHLQGHPIKSVC